MLTVLFLVAAAILLTSLVRRPVKFWQRAIVALAGVLMLAVLVAWGIELAMQTEMR